MCHSYPALLVEPAWFSVTDAKVVDYRTDIQFTSVT